MDCGTAYIVLLQVSLGRVLCLLSLLIMTENVAGMHSFIYTMLLCIIAHEKTWKQTAKFAYCAPFCEYSSLIIQVLCIHGSEQMVNWFAGICTTDAVPPAPASFNDSRCANASCCVDSTDPLLFTCELRIVLGLRVTFPNGDKEIVSIDDKAGALNVPVGFKVELNMVMAGCRVCGKF